MLKLFVRRTRWLAPLLISIAAYTSNAAHTVTDDTGRKLALPDPPHRIVSLAPSATEMLFAAGGGDQLVATSEYSDEPAAARQVPRIGDSSAVDIEKLVSLKPDVVIVWSGGNNAAQVEQIASLRLPIYRQQVGSLTELAGSLRRIGQLAGTSATAEAAARDVGARLERLRNRYSQLRPITVLLQVWNRPIYTVGGKQIISDALDLCGARNVFGDLKELGPAVDVEAVVARNPEVIIAAAAKENAAEWLAEWRKFGHLRAVRQGNLVAFEDPRLSRLGPSVVAATENLCAVIDAARRRGVKATTGHTGVENSPHAQR